MKKTAKVFSAALAATVALSNVSALACTGLYVGKEASADGTTMAFLTMSMAEIFHSFNMRSQRGSVFTLKSQNWFLWGAMLLSLAATTAVIYVPFLSAAFGFAQISLAEYAVALGLAVLVIPIVELAKWVRRSRGKSAR